MGHPVYCTSYLLSIARINLSTAPRCQLHHPIYCIVLFVASPCLLCHLPEVLHTLIYCITVGRLNHPIYCIAISIVHCITLSTISPHVLLCVNNSSPVWG